MYNKFQQPLNSTASSAKIKAAVFFSLRRQMNSKCIMQITLIYHGPGGSRQQVDIARAGRTLWLRARALCCWCCDAVGSWLSCGVVWHQPVACAEHLQRWRSQIKKGFIYINLLFSPLAFLRRHQLINSSKTLPLKPLVIFSQYTKNWGQKQPNLNILIPS